MIHVYSIEEIIDASNKIYQSKDIAPRDKINTIKQEEGFSGSNKKIIEQDLVELECFHKEKPLILKNETSLTKRIPIKVNNINKEDLINNLYKTYKGKIKKNTLELITNLKQDIVELDNKISMLKFKSIKENENNELLKNDIFKLMNVERNLKYNLKKENLKTNLLLKESENFKLSYEELEEKLKFHKKEIQELKKKNENLQIDNTKKLEDIENYQKEINELKENKNNLKLTSDLEVKIKHYQEENLRIGSVVMELQKKLEIGNKEAINYKNQRTQLIDKLNSVNDVIKNADIVTDAFKNNLNVKGVKSNNQNYDKLNEKKSLNLDDEIRSIFEK